MKYPRILFPLLSIALCSLTLNNPAIIGSVYLTLFDVYAVHKGPLIIYDFTKFDGLFCVFRYNSNASQEAAAVVFQRCPQETLFLLENFVNSEIGRSFLRFMLEPDLMQAYWIGRTLDFQCRPHGDFRMLVLRLLGERVRLVKESCTCEFATNHLGNLKLLYRNEFIGRLFAQKQMSLCFQPMADPPQQITALNAFSFLDVCLYTTEKRGLRTLEAILNTTVHALSVARFITLVRKSNAQMAYFAASLLSIYTYRMRSIFRVFRALLSKNVDASVLLAGLSRYATISNHGAELCAPEVLTGIRAEPFLAIRRYIINSYLISGPSPEVHWRVLMSLKY
jgi:hypothetical protein